MCSGNVEWHTWHPLPRGQRLLSSRVSLVMMWTAVAAPRRACGGTCWGKKWMKNIGKLSIPRYHLSLLDLFFKLISQTQTTTLGNSDITMREVHRRWSFQDLTYNYFWHRLEVLDCFGDGLSLWTTFSELDHLLLLSFKKIQMSFLKFNNRGVRISLWIFQLILRNTYNFSPIIGNYKCLHWHLNLPFPPLWKSRTWRDHICSPGPNYPYVETKEPERCAKIIGLGNKLYGWFWPRYIFYFISPKSLDYFSNQNNINFKYYYFLLQELFHFTCESQQFNNNNILVIYFYKWS